MGIEKTILVVFIVGLIAAALIGVTALTSGNNLSANTGTLKHIEVKENSDKEDIIPTDFTAKITLEQAKEIALKNVAGTIKDGALEDENGNIVYNIDVLKDNTETEVKIDPNNGNVLKIEKDTNTDDKKDNKDDTNENDSGDDESD